MPDPDPELAHPEAAGWVLGTLDRDEAEWFAGHLPSCPDCRAAVAEFGPTARLLATAAPADLPPPGLQARTLAGVARVATEARELPGISPQPHKAFLHHVLGQPGIAQGLQPAPVEPGFVPPVRAC